MTLTTRERLIFRLPRHFDKLVGSTVKTVTGFLDMIATGEPAAHVDNAYMGRNVIRQHFLDLNVTFLPGLKWLQRLDIVSRSKKKTFH